MMTAPIEFDRSTGAMRGANLLERGVGLALVSGSKVSSLFAHRGYNACANLIKACLRPRDINVILNPDATFSFPYSDGYWSKLLNRAFKYEDELEMLLRNSADVDYTLLDCGANYGYWSVLVTSQPFGGRKSIAMEPSQRNFSRLAHNASINGGRFDVVNAAIGAARGTATLSGNRHEAFSIAGEQDAGGEVVPVIALDDLIADRGLAVNGKYIIKLDVEGVEIDAMKGAARLLQADSVVVCEEHGNDPTHAVTRYILEQTAMQAIIHDPHTDRFEVLSELSVLDRIKINSNAGYNVFGTSSTFWQMHILSLNDRAARRPKVLAAA